MKTQHITLEWGDIDPATPVMLTFNRDDETLDVRANGASVEVVSATEAPASYYNMQGLEVTSPTRGLFIRRQGSTTSKVIIR